MALKAIFLDMDGVLYDSMGHHAESWTKAFALEKIPYTKEDTYANEGRTSTGTINLAFNRHLKRDATAEEIKRIYEAKTAMVTNMPQAKILNGMQTFVNLMQSKGFALCVVTGSKQPSLLVRLEQDFGITSQFVVSGKDVVNEKPHPEPYLRAMEKTGVKATEAIVIENAPLGIQSAKSAGIFTVAVNTGPLSNNMLQQSGANIVLSGTHLLEENWNEIINSYQLSVKD